MLLLDATTLLMMCSKAELNSRSSENVSIGSCFPVMLLVLSTKRRIEGFPSANALRRTVVDVFVRARCITGESVWGGGASAAFSEVVLPSTASSGAGASLVASLVMGDVYHGHTGLTIHLYVCAVLCTYRHPVLSRFVINLRCYSGGNKSWCEPMN